MNKRYDAIIVGGGPAGLSCALILGRCRRSVLVFDTGMQRNRASQAMHAFPSREGEHPLVFLDKMKEELLVYDIRTINKEIVDVRRDGRGFLLKSVSGETFTCKKLLLATGMVDVLPPIEGIAKYYGKGVFHCPYCDGWELRDKPWLVCASSGKAAEEVCLRLKTWTSDVTLLSAYTRRLRADQLTKLRRNGVKIVTLPVKQLSGEKGRLDGVLLSDGTRLQCEALFFFTLPQQHSDLARKLGCKVSRKGSVEFNKLQQTNVPGVFVAGDMARDMQLLVIAAAEGAKAGVVINAELSKDERVK